MALSVFGRAKRCPGPAISRDRGKTCRKSFADTRRTIVRIAIARDPGERSSDLWCRGELNAMPQVVETERGRGPGRHHKGSLAGLRQSEPGQHMDLGVDAIAETLKIGEQLASVVREASVQELASIFHEDVARTKDLRKLGNPAR